MAGNKLKNVEHIIQGIAYGAFLSAVVVLFSNVNTNLLLCVIFNIVFTAPLLLLSLSATHSLHIVSMLTTITIINICSLVRYLLI